MFMDLKSELQNFKTINLDEIAQGDLKVSDNVRNSVFLYNKAIESLKSGSEDIAAIELKKAISMNPHFYEALNLLGLCYSILGENEKAAEAFGQVIKAESNSVLALNYVKRFGFAEPAPQQKAGRANRQGRQSRPGQPRQSQPEQPGSAGLTGQQGLPGMEGLPQPDRQGRPEEPLKRARTSKAPGKLAGTWKYNAILHTALKIGIGFAAGLLLSALIFTAFPREGGEPENQPPDTAEDAIEELKAEYEAKLKELQDKYNVLTEDKETAVQQADYYKASLKLYEIDELAGAGKYEEAANMLFLMKTVDFKDNEKTKFDDLYKTVMPLAAKEAYNEGYKLYNSRKYQEALERLEKVQTYDPEFNRMDAALYYTGRSYQILQDSRSALALFQKLVDTYPKSYYARSARTRINELTKKP